MQEFIDLGKKIYNMKNPREKHRMVVFVARAMLHRRDMNSLLDWFRRDEARRQIIEESPFPMEQVTRAFFYKGSTFRERMELIKAHVAFLQKTLKPKAFLTLSSVYRTHCEVWHSEYEGMPWCAILKTETGQRKEGMLSLEMNLGEEHLYQMMFWIAPDEADRISLWIGAMQGPNMQEAKDVIKKITKACFGYRTKNLILYMLQAVARAWGIQCIYAVTNYGYYANNHVRSNRKLKTNFGDFWEEAGGHPLQDKRFYELPLVEQRKSMEEVKTHKRNLYRKRFAFLDAVDAEISENMKKVLK